MPLCNRCRSEAEYTTIGQPNKARGGERDTSLPVGIGGGQSCSRYNAGGD